MIRHSMFAAAFAVSAAIGLPALAQDQVTIATAESEEYGRYLTDADGRALYLFTADTQGTADQEPVVSCSGGCLDAWPPLYAAVEPQAGEQVDASMLGTIEHDGKSMVTYNGWPLYYFVKDEGPGQVEGQDIESFGGEWYLVTPEGEAVEHE